MADDLEDLLQRLNIDKPTPVKVEPVLAPTALETLATQVVEEREIVVPLAQTSLGLGSVGVAEPTGPGDERVDSELAKFDEIAASFTQANESDRQAVAKLITDLTRLTPDNIPINAAAGEILLKAYGLLVETNHGKLKLVDARAKLLTALRGGPRTAIQVNSNTEQLRDILAKPMTSDEEY